jgi:hypothetical protein
MDWVSERSVSAATRRAVKAALRSAVAFAVMIAAGTAAPATLPAPPLSALAVRRWTDDGAVASLLVYVPKLGEWFEGDDMPPDVSAFAAQTHAVRLR